MTPYFIESGISIIMKKPGRDQGLFKFVTVLESDVWIGIGVVILATALLLWIFEKCSPFSSCDNNSKDQVKIIIRFFGMAAMPFPCYGILLIQGNLPGIFPMSTLKVWGKLVFLSPISKYFKMELEIGNGPAWHFNSIRAWSKHGLEGPSTQKVILECCGMEPWQNFGSTF